MVLHSHLKKTEYRALAISLALHALFFLWIFFFADRTSDELLKVAIVIEQAQLRSPEIIDETKLHKEQPKKKAQKSKSRLEKKQTARAGKKSAQDSPRVLSDPWQEYEQRMFAQNRTNSTTVGSGDARRGVGWGEEKTGRTAKRGEAEQVKVPPGSSSSATRWRKGSARRLLSLPPIDYPESVRRKSGQGVVELLIEVDAQGHVESVEIVKSSGITRLDINARNAYRRAVFSPSPSGESATGIVSVTFRMKDN